MTIQNRSVWPDHYNGVVEGAAAELGVALIDAADDGYFVLLRRLANRREIFAVEADCVGEELRVQPFRERHVATGAQPPYPSWISGDVRLRENHEPGLVRSGFLNRRNGVRYRPGTVQQHRRSLHNSYSHHLSPVGLIPAA